VLRQPADDAMSHEDVGTVPIRRGPMLQNISMRIANVRNRLWLALRLMRQKPVRIDMFGDDYSRSTYQRFIARHPKFPVIRRKSFGAALRDLDTPPGDLFAGSRFAYMRRSVRRARKRGYVVRRFDPLAHFTGIMRVNTSSAMRQGRPIQSNYVDPAKVAEYCRASGPWYGVFDSQQALRGYCHMAIVGDCCIFARILGDAEYVEDGIMYLLVHDTLCEMQLLKTRTGNPRWAMYDMFLGGLQGLRDFKHRCGFEPYRVVWHWRHDQGD
jgi:hypothetical protein